MPLTAVTCPSSSFWSTISDILKYPQVRDDTMLRSCYRVDFPLRECFRNGKGDHLQNAFEVMYVTRHKPRGAALFEGHGDKCETNSFYFSPEAVTLISALLESLGAIVCEPPRLAERLVLLVGVQTNLRYRRATFSDRKLRSLKL